MTFRGELFLRLADEGRLVVDAARADEAIAGLERTLVEIESRLRILRAWRQDPVPPAGGWPEEDTPSVVEVLFADQVAPGQLERAATEIPKYIEALRRARPGLTGGDEDLGERRDVRDSS
ncbi:hypothetical protein [Actinoplanes sp. M2I2]|uniref:hypothetical protein n=1 Tax=Actinoplanes sp. M2I2 TaxID=1734444 RepID=UPI0020212E5A|nr:hypothetical protein [Actinoplanes sp. M2I2]